MSTLRIREISVSMNEKVAAGLVSLRVVRWGVNAERERPRM